MTYTVQIGGKSPFPLITNFLSHAIAAAQSQAVMHKQKEAANG